MIKRSITWDDHWKTTKKDDIFHMAGKSYPWSFQRASMPFWYKFLNHSHLAHGHLLRIMLQELPGRNFAPSSGIVPYPPNTRIGVLRLPFAFSPPGKYEHICPVVNSIPYNTEQGTLKNRSIPNGRFSFLPRGCVFCSIQSVAWGFLRI